MCVPLCVLPLSLDSRSEAKSDFVSKLQTSIRLAATLQYLRQTYSYVVHARSRRSEYSRDVASRYCFWCGCAYDDAEDMKENCPGEDEVDH